MSRGTRVMALAVLVLCVAAIGVGRMPGLQLPAVDHCPWNPWSHAGCTHDDGLRATIGWPFSLALAISAVLAAAVAWRPRRDLAVVWSAATLVAGGLVAVVMWRFAAPDPPFAVPLWPGVAFGLAVRAIGVLHLVHLVAPAVWTRRRRAPRSPLPRAAVTRRTGRRAWPWRSAS